MPIDRQPRRQTKIVEIAANWFMNTK